MTEEHRYKREVAYRITSDMMKELIVIPRDEEEYAAQYFALPDGTKINRVFVVGTLISVDDVGKESPFYKLRVSDLKGVFNATIGTYSPEGAMTTIEEIDPPVLVAMIGKIKFNEFEEKIFFNIAVESINEVDEHTRDLYDTETEEHTHRRAESNV